MTFHALVQVSLIAVHLPILIHSSSPSAIPIIDIAPLVSPISTLSQRRAVASQINSACQDIGFFAIINHGVSKSTIDDLLLSFKEFFDLPLEKKMLAKSSNDEEYPYGYEQREILSKGKKLDEKEAKQSCSATEDMPDLKETYAIGPSNPLSGMPARRYPPICPLNFQSTIDAYYADMESLAQNLLRGFALALDLDENWFADKFDRHQCALRTLNYPEVEGREAQPGQIRAGAHTDYGAFTILRTNGRGLQVTKDIVGSSDSGGEENDDGWVDAPDLTDAFIVNIGDMMRRWTNEKWVSTLHRVIVPINADTGTAAETAKAQRRQSAAFFVNANGDAIVEPILTCVDEANPAKYEAVIAGEYLLRKHLASMGKDL